MWFGYMYSCHLDIKQSKTHKHTHTHTCAHTCACTHMPYADYIENFVLVFVITLYIIPMKMKFLALNQIDLYMYIHIWVWTCEWQIKVMDFNVYAIHYIL